MRREHSKPYGAPPFCLGSLERRIGRSPDNASPVHQFTSVGNASIGIFTLVGSAGALIEPKRISCVGRICSTK